MNLYNLLSCLGVVRARYRFVIVVVAFDDKINVAQ